MPEVNVAQLGEWVGREIGVSDWQQIDQERINAFADITLDHQFIHVDPERAAKSPFGGTIAHGFMTLALLPHFGRQCALRVTGAKALINFGLEKVRFVNPVRVGSRIRGRFTLERFNERSPGQYQLAYKVTVEIDGQEKPALVAEWLSLQMM